MGVSLNGRRPETSANAQKHSMRRVTRNTYIHIHTRFIEYIHNICGSSTRVKKYNFPKF